MILFAHPHKKRPSPPVSVFPAHQPINQPGLCMVFINHQTIVEALLFIAIVFPSPHHTKERSAQFILPDPHTIDECRSKTVLFCPPPIKP